MFYETVLDVGHYILLPATFQPGIEMPFYLTLYANSDVSVVPCREWTPSSIQVGNTLRSIYEQLVFSQNGKKLLALLEDVETLQNGKRILNSSSIYSNLRHSLCFLRGS